MPECKTCGNAVNGRSKGLQCSGPCEEFYHSKCANITPEIFQAVQTDGVTWCCVACKNSKRRSIIIQDDNDARAAEESSSNTPLSDKTSSNFLPELNTTTTPTMFEVSSYLKELGKVILDIHQSQTFIAKQMEEIKSQNKMIIRENNELKEKLKFSEENCIKMEKKINVLEANDDVKNQLQIANNIVIAGLPVGTENPELVFKNITTKINVKFTPDDIINYRFLPQHQEGTASFVVELKTLEYKQEILKKKRIHQQLFTNDIGLGITGNKEIFIRHHLTALQSKLYYEAKQIKQHWKFRFLWYKDGTIFLRKNESTKVYAVRSHNDIGFINNKMASPTLSNTNKKH